MFRHLVAVMDGQRTRDGLALVEGHIQPRMLAEVVEHVGKILRRTGDEAVAVSYTHLFRPL